MATRKGVELRTDFTGSDKNFKPVLDRTKRGVKSLGTEAQKAGVKGSKGLERISKRLDQIKAKAMAAKGKLAALAAVIAIVKTSNEKARDALQDSQRANMDVERFQKLAFVLKGFRIEAEDTADIVRELSNVTQEALDEPDGGKASAFKMLQMDVEKFAALDPVQKLQALAEAQKRLTGQKSIRALDELISDQGMKLDPVLRLSNEEFAKRLQNAPAVPESQIRAQADQFEFFRKSLVGEGINKFRRAAGVSVLENPFAGLKDQKFAPLGDKSPFDPSIKFDPVGDKEAEDEKKELDKLDKLLNKINKPNTPRTLMGLTVDGKSMRPVQNKMLTVMEKLAALNAKQFKIESESLDLLEQELRGATK